MAAKSPCRRQARRLRQGPRRKRFDPGPIRNGPTKLKRLELLRISFARIRAQGGIAGLVFYQKLFSSEPALRELFHTSIELQTRKLMESLSYVVATLEDPEALVPVLEGLGRRHVVYGVCDHHYDLVTKALSESFKEILGESFTREVEEAWRQALDFVAITMKRGAGQYRPADGSVG